MERRRIRTSSGSATVFGIVLVALGIVVLVARETGLDLGAMLASAGWPFFIIVPGLVLLLLAVVAAPPQGLGVAIGGSVVTTVGLILLYQESTGHWERWAYMWALIPGAVGVATVVYGLASRHRELVVPGLRTTGVAAVLLAAGWWYFEPSFENGRPPIDLGASWPLIVIVVGAFVTVTALLRSPRSMAAASRADTHSVGGETP
jgi:hypothetical protein